MIVRISEFLKNQPYKESHGDVVSTNMFGMNLNYGIEL